jgi:hypothetical protein
MSMRGELERLEHGTIHAPENGWQREKETKLSVKDIITSEQKGIFEMRNQSAKL